MVEKVAPIRKDVYAIIIFNLWPIMDNWDMERWWAYIYPEILLGNLPRNISSCLVQRERERILWTKGASIGKCLLNDDMQIMTYGFMHRMT